MIAVMCCVLLAIVGKFKLSSNRLLKIFFKCLRKGSIILRKLLFFRSQSARLSVSLYMRVCLFQAFCITAKIMYIAGRILLDWYCLAISNNRTAVYSLRNETKLAFYHFPFCFYGKRVMWKLLCEISNIHTTKPRGQ